MPRSWLAIVATFVSCITWSRGFAVGSNDHAPLLLRDPTISATQVAFSYAGFIWIARRDGTELRQLTHGGHDRRPRFSPDGSQIAFTAGYIDNVYERHESLGIYLVRSEGGEPRRLTYHPADIAAVAWTPDGKRVLFSSRRAGFDLHEQDVVQLFSVSAEGGFAEQVPLPRGVQAAFSPDAGSIAYVPSLRVQPEWKRYRGGQTTPIWIARMADSSIQARVPRDNSNDSNPMWVGDSVYFLSDREGAVTLFAYDLRTEQVNKIVENDDFDIKSASATSDAIVYDKFGSLHILDLVSGGDRTLDVHPMGDFPETHRHIQKVALSEIRFADLSPTGEEAVFGARGEIFRAAAGSGDVHDITGTPDVVERDPAFAPDGLSIAYFSDESGEYALHISHPTGHGEIEKISLGSPPGFYSAPAWSPDSTKIGYSDQRLNLWYVDLQRKIPVRVDADLYPDRVYDLQMAWSPDSAWIAYTKQLSSDRHALFLYSLRQAKSFQVTDGESDVLHIAFDRGGRYLYFTASIDAALASAWLDMSSLQRPVTRSVHILMLKRGAISPLAPEGDGERVDEIRDTTVVEKAPITDIDIDGLNHRILTLPIPARNYYDLIPGKPGVLFLVEGPPVNPPLRGNTITKVHRFEMKTQEVEQILDNVVAFERNLKYVTSFRVSFDGNKMLYSQQGQWLIAPVDRSSAIQAVALDLAHMETRVDPRAEWKHIYQQVWRDERDFFYDPGFHGLNIAGMEKKYSPFLTNISTREDLSYLLSEMLSNLRVGHLSAYGVHGKDLPERTIGLLGADYSVEAERYRFARIYESDPWSKVVGPLTQPGGEVKVGEYLLKVDGQDVRPVADIYSFFGGKAGTKVVLTVGPRADGAEARQVTVVPVGDETPLRNYAWVEERRHRVDELSGGRVAYVYLPDTAALGYASFNRSYFSQVGKSAVVIDARYNYGGAIADHVIDYLRRSLMNFWYVRYGRDIPEPQEAIFGPKVMIINEMTTSGGDSLAWMFRKAGLGPLVGERTWGGLTFGLVPDDLLDGGVLSTPNRAFYNPNGAWDIENHGVAPDVEIEEDPKAVRQGHDPQLEKAVKVVMDLLDSRVSPAPKHPPFPNYQRVPP